MSCVIFSAVCRQYLNVSFFLWGILIFMLFLYLSLPCFLIETDCVCVCVCVCVRACVHALVRASKRVDTVAIFFHCCFVYGLTFDVTFEFGSNHVCS